MSVIQTTKADGRLIGARYIARADIERIAVSCSDAQRIVMLDTSLASIVAGSIKLDSRPGALRYDGHLWTVTDSGHVLRLTAADTPTVKLTIDTKAATNRWLCYYGNFIAAPGPQGTILTLDRFTGATIDQADDVLDRIEFVTEGAGYLYALDGHGSGVVFTVGTTGIITEIAPFAATDCEGVLHAFVDGTRLVVGIPARNAINEYDLTDPTTPVLVKRTPYDATLDLRSVLNDTAHTAIARQQVAALGFTDFWPLTHGVKLDHGETLFIDGDVGNTTHFYDSTTHHECTAAELDAAVLLTYTQLQAFAQPFFQTQGVTFALVGSYPESTTGSIVVNGTVAGLATPSLYRVDIFGASDIDYLIGSVTLTANGAWTKTLTFSTAATKLARLVRISDSVIIAEALPDRGLLRSFNVPQGDPLYAVLHDRTYVYDQSVAIVAISGYNDQTLAEKWVTGLLLLQHPGTPAASSVNGQFAFSYYRNAWDPSLSYVQYVDPYFRTGAQAWVAMALEFFIRRFPASTVVAAARTALGKLLDALILNYYVNSGGGYQTSLFRGGKGKYASDYSSFDPTYVVPSVGTEHTVDCWWAYTNAAAAGVTIGATAQASVGGKTYAQLAALIGPKLTRPTTDPNGGFWRADVGRAVQGITSATVYDTDHALDCDTWYSIAVYAIDPTSSYVEDALADAAANYTAEDFAHVARGYTPYRSDRGYPGAVGELWIEGTCGYAFAQVIAQKLPEAAGETLCRVTPEQRTDGFPYTDVNDVPYELLNYTSVASTAWYLLTFRHGGFWQAVLFPTLPGSTLNVPPTVNAGVDQTVTYPTTAPMAAAVTDPDNTPTLLWTKASGPGTVTFTASATILNPVASFSVAGTYTLRLTANDGVNAAVSDDMVVTVNANVPPTVNAGVDQSITLPSTALMAATVTDPDSSPTLLWTKVSGPGTATFSSSATILDPTVTFSVNGTYVLRLTADDGVNAPVSDDVQITVAAAGADTYAGGSFSNPRASLAHLIGATPSTGSLNATFNGQVNGIAMDLSGNVYAVGAFTTVNGITRNRACAFDSSGTLLSWNPNLDALGSCIVLSGSTLFIGGTFANVGGVAHAGLVAVGTNGAVDANNFKVNGGVNAIAIDGSGNIYGVGSFGDINGTSRGRCAKWNSSYALQAWDPGCSLGDAFAVCVFNSKVYLGGAFASPRNKACAVDQSVGTLDAWNPAPNDNVRAILGSGSNLWLGGDFTTVNALSRARVALVDATSAADQGVSLGISGSLGRVNTFFLASGVLFIGGAFTTVLATARSFSAAIDASTFALKAWAPATDGQVFAIVQG